MFGLLGFTGVMVGWLVGLGIDCFLWGVCRFRRFCWLFTVVIAVIEWWCMRFSGVGGWLLISRLKWVWLDSLMG